MILILLSGCGGRMGNAVASAAEESNGKFMILGGIDPNVSGNTSRYPVFGSAEEAESSAAMADADVIVDFSHHTALPALAALAVHKNIPLLIASTGHTAEELEILRETAKKIPVFYSRNMSLGINLLIELCRRARATLGDDFDVEIIEKHHNKKLDAPSGTALMIADAIRGEDTEYVYDRHAVRRPRGKQEIGIHAVRGGSIVGEHEVLFAGKDETVTLSHSATSREVFATGALRAAEFLVTKPAGLYSMEDLVAEMI